MSDETSPSVLPADTISTKGPQMGEINKHECCERVRSGTIWRPQKCSNPAKVQVDGKWYCGIHDPVRIAKREAEKRAQWDEQYTENARKYRLQAAAPDMLAALQSADEWMSCVPSPLRDGSPFKLDRERIRAAIAKATGKP